MVRRPLIEGFAAGAANGIRKWFARSPEAQRAEIQRGGAPSVERAGLPFNLVSQFGYDSLAEHLRIDQDLQSRYTDYEEMDEYGEISSALDIYADDSAMPDMERGKSIWVTSENKGVERELNDVLHKRLLIEDDIWGLERTVAKYGNAFGELLVNDSGLIGINFLPPPTMRRVEGPRGQLIGFVQDVRGEFNLSLEDFYKLAKDRNNRPQGELTVFEDWEVVHWRLRGKHLRSVYGHGVADSARWVWKRLAMLEDALLIYKLSRAPARYAFYVDIGEYDMERGLAYVNRVKNQFVKKKFVNPSTGKLDMRHNPLSHDEDFFIPSKGGKDSTRIEVLQGPDYAETDTVEYHRDKLVSALKVPKAYMGYGGEASKASLSSEDIRFARTVMRLQRETRGGVRKACRVHLIARGADVDKNEYDVQMSVPSAIMELAKLEVLSATADLAARTQEFLPTRWALMNLFHMSEQEAVELMELKDSENMRKAKNDAKAQRLMALAQGQEQGQEDDDRGSQPGRFDFGRDDDDKDKNKNGKPDDEEEDGKKESRRRGSAAVHGSDSMVMMERRVQRMLEAHHKKIERSFDRKVGDIRVIEEKVDRVLREDPQMRARMRQVRQLLGEFRSQAPH